MAMLCIPAGCTLDTDALEMDRGRHGWQTGIVEVTTQQKLCDGSDGSNCSTAFLVCQSTLQDCFCQHTLVLPVVSFHGYRMHVPHLGNA